MIVAEVVGVKRIPLSRNCADKSFVFEGAVSCVFWRWPAGQLWILLGKGGVAARPRKFREATLARADGVVQTDPLPNFLLTYNHYERIIARTLVSSKCE